MPFGFKKFLHRLLEDVHTPHYFNEIALVGVAADKPAGADAKDNMLYYETDTGLWKRYRTALTSWVIVTSIAQIMGYDYTATLLKNLALDPETKALLIKSEVTGAGGAATLLELTDFPDSYVDQTKKYPRVKATEDGLEFVVDIHGICFVLKGEATTGTKKTQALIPCSLTTPSVIVYSDDAPTGTSLIVDVNKNGTTIFTTQGNRPQIAIGAHYDESGTPDITSFAKGDRVSIDVDQVGSTVKGGNDLIITVIC